MRASTRVLLAILGGLTLGMPSAATAEDGASPAAAGAQESYATDAMSLTWQFAVASKYLFQGVDYSQGEPVVQPEFALSVRNFSATLWVNHDLQLGDSNEFDFLLSYTRELPGVSLTMGYAHNDYPHRGWSPSQEVFCEAGLPAAFEPTLAINYDYDQGKGAYATLGTNRQVQSGPLPVTFGASVYYQHEYYGSTGFPAAEFQLSTDLRQGAVLFSPAISRTLTWDNGDFTDTGAVPASWLFSLNVSQAF